MRTLTSHLVEGQKDDLQIHAHDHHQYEIGLNGIGSGNSEAGALNGPFYIRFQKDDPHNGVVNGASLESVISIVIDRLTTLQSGPQACEEYASALTHAQATLESLRALAATRVERDRIEAERLKSEAEEAARVQAEKASAPTEPEPAP